MKKSLKKRGQKFITRFYRASAKASEEGKEHLKENFIDRLSHVRNIRLLILEWGLLVVALIMLAATQAFWFSNSYSEDTFVAGGTFTEATLGKINSLNPLFATTSSEKTLSRLMFATLSTVDYSGHPNAGLAEYIHSSDNGRIWTIKLKEELKWSDGEPITNEDIIFTVGLIQNPAVTSIYDSDLSNVKVEESENGEITFTLSSAYADFISALDFPIIPHHILKDANPKMLVEHPFSLNPVSSGAFSFNAIQSVSADGEKIIYLSSNPHYYGGRPMLNSFAIHTFSDKDAIIKALNSGTVAATAELDAVDAEKITAGAIYQRNSSIASGAFIFFNTQHVTDKNLRTAIRNSLDVNILRTLAGDVAPLDYPLLSTQISLNFPALPEHNAEENPDLGNGVTLELVTVNSGYLPVVADFTAGMLRAMGFTVNLNIYEENQEFITNTIANRNYDLLIYEIELGADPDILPYYHSSQASNSGLNLSNYRNALVDDLLVAGRGTTDPTLRAKKYETFLNYWVNDVPAIGLYQSELAYFYNKNTRAFSNDVRIINPLDRFSDVTSWAAVKGPRNRTP